MPDESLTLPLTGLAPPPAGHPARSSHAASCAACCPRSAAAPTCLTPRPVGVCKDNLVHDDGCVIVSAVLPDSIEAGRHTLSFAGTDLSGSPVTFTRDITVAAPDVASPPPAAGDQPLPATGATISRLALLALLALAGGTAVTRSGRRIPER